MTDEEYTRGLVSNIALKITAARKQLRHNDGELRKLIYNPTDIDNYLKVASEELEELLKRQSV